MPTDTPSTTLPPAPPFTAENALQKMADMEAAYLQFKGKDGYNPWMIIQRDIVPLRSRLQAAIDNDLPKMVDSLVQQIKELKQIDPVVQMFKPATPPLARTPGSSEIIQTQPVAAPRGVNQ